MAQYYQPHQGAPAYGPSGAQNLQFYDSSYSPGVGVSGRATPSQAAYGYGGGAGGFGGPGASGGVSGRMGEQGGLRTGWLAAFSTEGYEGEPPLLEELGVNFNHIGAKVRKSLSNFLSPRLPHGSSGFTRVRASTSLTC